MRAMLRVEGQWAITDAKQTPKVFLVTIDGEVLIEA